MFLAKFVPRELRMRTNCYPGFRSNFWHRH